MRTGAAGVIVGYGSTEGATTTREVLGIGVPMATAIADAAAARRDYLDETGGRYVHVIADGDITTSGDFAKAIACGADAAVIVRPSRSRRRLPAAAGSGRPRRHTRRCRAARCCRCRTASVPHSTRCSTARRTTRTVRSTSSAACVGRWRSRATPTIKEFQKVGLSVRA